MMDHKAFATNYMSRLNAQQRAAVYAVDGPVLLLATPGSGKTTVLVTRLGYMVHCRGIAPESILTMTYTVAATKDMRSRYASFFGEGAATKLQFRTINGVSAKIIDYAGRNHAGRPPFDLATDEGELNQLLRSIYQSVNDSYPEDSDIKELRRLITYIKNMMLGDEDIQKLESSVDKLPEIYQRYKETLRRRHQMDYDDQMAYAYTILQRFPEVLRHFQEQYRYICVDEAQDSSKIQHELIRLLASGSENLFMVGDEDQSIYGFRAAYPDALLRFEAEHPNAKVLLMEENYRSTAEIVAAANRFVAENQFRHKKSIIATRGNGAPVHVVRAKSRVCQFEYLVNAAKCCTGETAILFRNNDTALPLIDLLEKNKVTYNCRNVDDLFFSHRVVVDLLDIIRLAYSPQDEVLFLRLYYKFGAPISKKSAQYAVARSKASHRPIFEELMHAPEIRGAVQDTVIDLMQNLPQIPTDSAETAIHRIWEAMHYGRYVEQRKLDRGKYFILGMLARGIDSPSAILEKLDALRDVLAAHQNAPDNRVILSTIHSSKGLEYDTVYLADIMDGVLPSKTQKEVEDPDELRQYEEDRRLFYVGMTRAKNNLYLFRCGEPSSFISEIIQSLPVPVVDANDLFAPLLLPPVGKQYTDIENGKGEIVASCDDNNLVAFADGHCELLTVSEMFSRRSTAVTYAKQEEQPALSTPVKGPWETVPSAAPILSQLQVGGFIQHRSFGTGKVLSIENDVLIADFGEKGIRKLGLSLSIQNKLIIIL